MRKIIKKYLLVVAFAFLLLPILKVSADDASSTDASSTSTQATTTAPDQNSSSTATTTSPTNSTSTSTLTVNVFIRYNDQILFNGPVDVTTDSNAQISVTDDLGVTGQISAQSALAVLEGVDAQSDNFNISDLKHYSNGYFVNCINITTGTTTNSCTWNYVVNGESPWDAIDQKILHTGDSLTLYFGQPRKLITPNEPGNSSVPFTISAVSYDYQNNLWSPLSNVVVGATQPDPNNPWSPIVIATSTSDSTGNSIFDLSATGTYNFGLEEDYYYPTYPFEIIDGTTTATSTPSNQTGSSGGGSAQTHQTPNLESMLSFLDSHQNSDGGFGSDLYTDWAAIAYGASSGHVNTKEKLKQYIKSDSLDGTATTDYERRAMAMLALGLNPHTDGNENYIKKITDSFDGDQIGNQSQFNDDIFGIVTLLSSGYSSSDNIIQKSAQFIISKQSSSGEWDSIDLTGAAIQALSLVPNVPGSSSAITRGLNFLKSAQSSDGGFGNPDSTSWAIQGLIAGNSDPKQLMNNGNNPFDYLATNQMVDGSIGTTTDALDTRVWATEWAIPATMLETWSEILHNVPKQAELSGGSLLSTNASTTLVFATLTNLPAEDLTGQATTTSTTTDSVSSSKTLEVKRIIGNNLPAISSTTQTNQNVNPDQLAGVSGSGFSFNTHNTLMILGSILAGIGLFSIILI